MAFADWRMASSPNPAALRPREVACAQHAERARPIRRTARRRTRSAPRARERRSPGPGASWRSARSRRPTPGASAVASNARAIPCGRKRAMTAPMIPVASGPARARTPEAAADMRAGAAIIFRASSPRATGAATPTSSTPSGPTSSCSSAPTPSCSPAWRVECSRTLRRVWDWALSVRPRSVCRPHKYRHDQVPSDRPDPSTPPLVLRPRTEAELAASPTKTSSTTCAPPARPGVADAEGRAEAALARNRTALTSDFEQRPLDTVGAIRGILVFPDADHLPTGD